MMSTPLREDNPLISAASLKSPSTLREYTVKELGEIAKKVGVDNWRSLRKEQLVQTLVRHAKRREAAKLKKGTNGRTTKISAAKKSAPVRGQTKSSSKTKLLAKTSSSRKPRPKLSPQKMKRIQMLTDSREMYMDLSNGTGESSDDGDRVVLMVRDAFWLQVNWQLERCSVQRAQSAMAEMWHTAVPTLRVYEVDVDNETMAAESVVDDIRIHGGVNNWYIAVDQPPQSFRVEIGYLGTDGRFFGLARSNTVTTPPPGASDTLDHNWSDIAQDYERVYAMSGGYAEDHSSDELQSLFEERLRRPMGSPTLTTFGIGAERPSLKNRDFTFELDAEIIIYGATKPNAHVTLAGEPVRVRRDGTFTVRMSMPNRRQVLPVVAHSADGVEQRTIVLAVERNTKTMEPVVVEVNG